MTTATRNTEACDRENREVATGGNKRTRPSSCWTAELIVIVIDERWRRLTETALERLARITIF